MIFLAYIMIEVGMEFEIDKSQPRKYAVDYVVAMTAAAVPWLTAGGYFWWSLSRIERKFGDWPLRGANLGRDTFTMLAAAGWEQRGPIRRREFWRFSTISTPSC